MQRILRLTLTFCALLALAASPAVAQSFVVFSARHDAAAGQVVLVGSGFRADMRILLNGAPLPNAAVSSGEMRAKLPALQPGTYYLIVDGYGTDSCSSTTVTIDAPVSNQDASWSDIKTMYR